MIRGSSINKTLTTAYMVNEHENKYFDRKSAGIKPTDLARHISAFANADGGTLVIGIDDKTRALEGINSIGEDRINELLVSPKTCCKPMPRYQEEFVEIKNAQGKPDRLLLLHIEESYDQIIRTNNDKTYLRIGDRTLEMTGDDLRNLEYSKNARHYEDEVNKDASISDLDSELLEQYASRIDASDVPVEQMLRARGFTKQIDGKELLTNAAVLLFARNIYQFYPNCRIRFVRYAGNKAQTGMGINIIKDENIECCILRIIDKAKQFISTQLREFMLLNEKTGKFYSVPEYPEFAWFEGIVNAVAHREYAMSGNYIKVTMYDDRLEIESPGKLHNIVTVENIKDTRYSRNPRISRVLTEFGWVRELNEGVKRIYNDMKSLYLDPPEYSEPEQTVRLTLKNNIVVRTMRQQEFAFSDVGPEIWNLLDPVEQMILTYVLNRGPASRAQLEAYTAKSASTVRNRLNHMLDLSIIKANGNQFDPGRTYEANI